MGQMFYRALKKAGVETQMVIYPDERHAILQLPHQQDVLRRVLDWFASHDPATPTSSISK
jgi:dipeptidyl aminopeptidase/acylaminoacyl peptidase